MLFVIGGNGSHAGANAIHEEVNTSTYFFPLNV
jgi:6-phosphofructokinase